MKKLIVLFSLVFLSCASIEERIKEHSYTEEGYLFQGERYQVYRTKKDRKYIIVNTPNPYRVKRKYVTLPTKGDKNDTSYLEEYLNVKHYLTR